MKLRFRKSHQKNLNAVARFMLLIPAIVQMINMQFVSAVEAVSLFYAYLEKHKKNVPKRFGSTSTSWSAMWVRFSQDMMKNIPAQKMWIIHMIRRTVF